MRGGLVHFKKLAINFGLDACSLPAKVRSKVWWVSGLHTSCDILFKSRTDLHIDSLDEDLC